MNIHDCRAHCATRAAPVASARSVNRADAGAMFVGRRPLGCEVLERAAVASTGAGSRRVERAAVRCVGVGRPPVGRPALRRMVVGAMPRRRRPVGHMAVGRWPVGGAAVGCKAVAAMPVSAVSVGLKSSARDNHRSAFADVGSALGRPNYRMVRALQLDFRIRQLSRLHARFATGIRRGNVFGSGSPKAPHRYALTMLPRLGAFNFLGSVGRSPTASTNNSRFAKADMLFSRAEDFSPTRAHSTAAHSTAALSTAPCLTASQRMTIGSTVLRPAASPGPRICAARSLEPAR